LSATVERHSRTIYMREPETVKMGSVCLVGAGPGDPGLITMKGLQRLEAADVVVYDRLVDRRLVDRARADAEVINVGKLPGQRRNPQADINALLVERARAGKQVVRLKGGDPFIFGRGGEEAESLVDHGIPFEVVPGVTSAVAAPAYAGIPLTQRGVASSLTIVTGTESPDKPESAVAWDKLAQVDGTLVVLMGWDALASIAAALVRAGRSAETPVALVQWGSQPFQRTVVGTLADIKEKAGDAGVAPPVVAVIGNVVKLRDKLRWFDNRPLFGKRVLVTRTRAQASALSDLLYREGAEPLEAATIQIQGMVDYSELDAALGSLSEYDWVVFTSANTVQAVFDRLGHLGRDSRAFHSAQVASIGPGTAARLQEHGIVPDLVPTEFVSEAMVDALKHRGVAGARVLFASSDIRRDAIPDGLAGLGARVTEVTVYRNVVPKDAGARISEVLSQGIDVATFTSSSTVRNLAALIDGDLDRLGQARIACIGPITAAAVRETGLEVHMVAREHTIAGLVDALKAYYTREARSDG
jgi:uroporphyrinogen III methyltransferase/synthase